MSVVIGTNTAASVAANNLAYSTSMLQDSLAKLSSGSKIVNPSDDAGGLAVSMKLTATANRDGDLLNNLSDATSFLQTQDGALSVAGSILDRMSQLETLYQDPTKNSSDKANYDDEFTQLQSELTSLTSETFNGVSLFGTSTSASLNLYTTEDLSTSEAVAVSQQDMSEHFGVGIGSDHRHVGQQPRQLVDLDDHRCDPECRNDASDQRWRAEPARLRLLDPDHEPNQPAGGRQQHLGCGRRQGNHQPGQVERARPGRDSHADPSQSERPDGSETDHGLTWSAVRLIRPNPGRFAAAGVSESTTVQRRPPPFDAAVQSIGSSSKAPACPGPSHF